MVEGGGLENRRAQAPGVRIPLPPSAAAPVDLTEHRRRGWSAGYAELLLTPPADHPLGHSATGLEAAERHLAPAAARALALTCGPVGWLLLSLEASLVCPATAAAIAAPLTGRGWSATVVATGQREGAALSARCGLEVWRRQVVELARAAGWLATRRLAPATVRWSSGPLELGEPAPSETATPRLPYVDLLQVSPGPRRPTVVVATAALPRLVDPPRGEVRPGPWARAEAAATAALGERVVILGLPSCGAQEQEGRWQRTARAERLAGALAVACLTGLSEAGERLPPRLLADQWTLDLATLPLPDRYDLRQAADRAEFGCQDGPPAARAEATARWRWLEAVYELAGLSRSGPVTVPVTRLVLGPVTVLGVGLALSETVAFTLAESLDARAALIVEACGGRHGALLAQPERPTLAGARELEPLCDGWALDPRGVREIIEAVRERAA